MLFKLNDAYDQVLHISSQSKSASLLFQVVTQTGVEDGKDVQLLNVPHHELSLYLNVHTEKQSLKAR